MLKIENLCKSFGEKLVVSNMNFEAKNGDVLGFLGPNGAGKSTTMKMITCFLTPDKGDIIVDGKSVYDDPIAIKSMIGYMPENAPLYDEMTTEEFLRFICDIRGITSKRKEAIEEVVDICSLNHVYHQTLETLSKGFKRRVSMAQALIHDPQILILDEPTDGLDPNQKFTVRELIKKLSENKTIILSTHILEEVSAVCNRAIIIGEGKKLFDGTPGELESKSSLGKIDDVFRALTTGESVPEVQL